ncbi:MAG: hypothetical protein HY678_06715, partial [Chloroflexi bacterium]|nr:hypothetical protein [Chloroflexota bacterium]
LMLAVSLLVAASQERLLRRLRASTGAIQRAGAGLMVVVGAGLVYFSVATGTFERIFFPG